MGNSIAKLGAALLLGSWVSACGDDEGGNAAPGTGGSGQSVAGSSPVGGSAPGTGGSGGGASGGSAGGRTGMAGSPSSSVDCSGTFDAGAPIFSVGTSVAASLSVTADELELFFVLDTRSEEYVISVLKRATNTAAFGPTAEGVPSLQAACEAGAYPTLDVSNDGLRMYITCLDGSSPLRVATRASRSADWTLSAGSSGTVADSIGVSGDELTAVAVEGLETEPHPVLYRRSSLSEAFGASTPISGITGSFLSPDLAHDGSLLVGVLRSSDRSRIGVATATSAPDYFSAPSNAGMPVPSGDPATISDYTPALSQDCRRIYFLRARTTGSTTSYTIEMASR